MKPLSSISSSIQEIQDSAQEWPNYAQALKILKNKDAATSDNIQQSIDQIFAKYVTFAEEIFQKNSEKWRQLKNETPVKKISILVDLAKAWDFIKEQNEQISQLKIGKSLSITFMKQLSTLRNEVLKNINGVTRMYVPQEYAGIGAYNNEQQPIFLIATHGMGPCVGVSFYSALSKTGMIVHLDSDQKNITHLSDYFNQLFVAMRCTEKVEAKVILSEAEHEELDKNVISALTALSEFIEHKIITVKGNVACLVLNLQTGDIYTDYNEKALANGKQLALTLNAPDNFILLHLRGGKIYEQPLQDMKAVYSVESGIMLPQDTEAVKERQSHTSSSSSSSSDQQLIEPSGVVMLPSMPVSIFTSTLSNIEHMFQQSVNIGSSMSTSSSSSLLSPPIIPSFSAAQNQIGSFPCDQHSIPSSDPASVVLQSEVSSAGQSEEAERKALKKQEFDS